MSTKKISELIAAASVAATDLLAIVTLSDGTTKKATVSQLIPGVSSDGTTITFSKPTSNTADSKLTFKTIPVDILTAGATPTVLQAFSVGSAFGIVIIRALVTVHEIAGNATVGAWSVDMAFRNNGGTLTQLGTGGITPYGTPSAGLALAASLSVGTVTLTGTGVSSTNLRWTCNGFQNVAVS
jgi:hypothetical protein